MRDKFYIILGGSGFIGTNLVLYLQSNHIPYCNVDKNQPLIKDDRFINYDLTWDYHQLCFLYELIDDINIDKLPVVVINLASEKIPFYGERYESIYPNLLILYSSIEILKHYNADIIYTSTSDIYGESSGPNKESGHIKLGSSCNKRWCYGVSKVFGEHLYIGYAEKFNRNFSILRVSNCIGPYGGLKIPWKSGIVNGVCYEAIRNSTINIDCPLTLTRDFIHVDDFISALFTIINTKNYNKIFNISNPNNRCTVESLIPIVQGFCYERGISKPEVKTIKKDGNVEDIYYKSSNISEILSIGWEPKICLVDTIFSVFKYNLDHKDD